METISPCGQFLIWFEIQNKTFILDSHMPFICSVILLYTHLSSSNLRFSSRWNIRSFAWAECTNVKGAVVLILWSRCLCHREPSLYRGRAINSGDFPNEIKSYKKVKKIPQSQIFCHSRTIGSNAKRKCKNNRLTIHIFRLLKEKNDRKHYMYINVYFIIIILVFRSPHRLTVHSINNECRIQ